MAKRPEDHESEQGVASVLRDGLGAGTSPVSPPAFLEGIGIALAGDSLKTPIGPALDRIADALNRIADALEMVAPTPPRSD